MRRVSCGTASVWLIHLAAAVAVILTSLSRTSRASLSPLAGDWLTPDDSIYDGNPLLHDVTWNHGPQAELQCAFRVLNALASVCWMASGTKMADGATPTHPQLFPPPYGDQPSPTRMRDSGHCATPLPLVARLCAAPFSSASGGLSKRYTASDFVAARGRRKPTTSANDDLPPGFLASRGRRAEAPQQQEPHERQRKDDGADDLADLYLRGFYGSRG